MLLSSEDSIHIELGTLLSSGPATCLNSNKLFLFCIIMMRKAAGAGKCAFEMICCSYRFQATKKISPSPTLQIGDVFDLKCWPSILIKNWDIWQQQHSVHSICQPWFSRVKHFNNPCRSKKFPSYCRFT